MLQQSMSEVHSSVFVDVLRKPIPELADDVTLQARENAAAPDVFVQALSERFKAASPLKQEGGCEAHLKMILYVLSCLAQKRDRQE
jgi:hypothetical protein